MQPQQNSRQRSGAVTFMVLAFLVLIANAEGAPESGSTGYPVDNDMMEISMKETSGARDSVKMANQLDDLKKAVASKVKVADAESKKESSALKAKLAKDQKILKAAQTQVKTAPKSAGSPTTEANAAAAVASASSSQAKVGPKLLHTITKLQSKLKSVVAENDKKTAKEVEKVRSHYESKLKAVTEKLVSLQKQEKHMFHKVTKQSAKKNQARQSLASMRARKDKRKAQVAKAQELVKSLTNAVSKYHKKAQAEKKLRNKAVESALVLGQRIKKLSGFGKKASTFAKKQAVKAAKAKAKAHADVKRVTDEKMKMEKEAVKLKMMREQIKKELEQVKADKVAETAKRLHEVAKRRALAQQMVKIKTKIQKHKDHEAELHKRMTKHKAGEADWVKKAKGLQHQAEKAALALKKVDTIRQALVQSKMEVEHYKHENQVQRMELTNAAKSQLTAAAVTKKAAASAGAIQEHALLERNLYKKIVKKAKLQMEKEHAERMRLQNAEASLVQQAKTQLVQEHKKRVIAEASIAKKEAAVHAAKAAMTQEHEARLKLKAENEELKADRDQLLEREKAAARMIAVEQEATQEAKAAALSVKKVGEAKMAKLKDSYTALLKHAKDKTDTVKAQAATVVEKSKGLKAAIKKEKALLVQEEDKSRKERASWKEAVAAMDKERIARDVAKSKAESSSHDMAQVATAQVGKAVALMKTKALLLAEVKKDMAAQAKKFESASKDWVDIKLGLERRAEKAEQAAADANAKLSLYMTKRHEDSATKVATGAVEAALQKSKADASESTSKSKEAEKSAVKESVKDAVKESVKDAVKSAVPEEAELEMAEVPPRGPLV